MAKTTRQTYEVLSVIETSAAYLEVFCYVEEDREVGPLPKLNHCSRNWHTAMVVTLVTKK